jgi:hypothetical protein
VTGATDKQRIVELLKTNKFSLICDEPTDRSCIKNLCLVARINLNNEDIKDYILLRLDSSPRSRVFKNVEISFHHSAAAPNI